MTIRHGLLGSKTTAGNGVKYGYNSYGILIYTAINSSGQERHYEYKDALMTAIANEHWHILLRNRYEYGW